MVTGHTHLSKQTVYLNSEHFAVCNYNPIKKKNQKDFKETRKWGKGEILTSGENTKKRKMLSFKKK